MGGQQPFNKTVQHKQGRPDEFRTPLLVLRVLKYSVAGYL